MDNSTYDVVIVGGGIMGSSTAYSLMSADNKLKVAVVEMDPIYTRASTTLSMANVRIQFSLKQNIQISQYAFEVLERFEETMAVSEDKLNIAYRREGNLFLIDENGRSAATDTLALQKSLDCRVDWWSPETIKQHYPLYDMSGLVGGTFGPQDGHFDAYAVLMGYKAKARALGAEYIKGEVVELMSAGGRISGVKLTSGGSLSTGSGCEAGRTPAADHSALRPLFSYRDRRSDSAG
jgi:FAD-dependent oxidoreductase domain-containing protein 1